MGFLKTAACTAVLVCLFLALVSQSERIRPSRSASPSSSSGRRYSYSSRSRQRGSSRAQTVITCTGTTTFSVTEANLRRRPFKFKCPQGPVAEVKVVGVKGICRGNIPLLLSDVERCTWNPTCTISFPDTPIETRDSSTSGDFRCQGQKPESIEISYACPKKNADVKSLLGLVQTTNKTNGIVKSHRLYPWSYRDGDRLGNLTIVRPRAGYSTLWITLRTMDTLENDILFLSWMSRGPQVRGRGRGRDREEVRQIFPHDSTFDLAGVDNVVLTFFVDYYQYVTGTGKDHGFLLCYQWLRPNARPRGGSACTKVLQPAECSSTSRRTRPRNRTGTSGTRSRSRTRTRTCTSGTRSRSRTRTRTGTSGTRSRSRTGTRTGTSGTRSRSRTRTRTTTARR